MADRATAPDPDVIRAEMAETRRHIQEGLSALLDRLSGTDSAPTTQGETTVAKASGKPAKKAASAKAGKTGSAAKSKPAVKAAAKTTKKPAAKAAAKTTKKPVAKAVARTTKKVASTKPKTLLKKAVKAAKDVLVDVGEGALAGAVQGAAGAAAEHLGAATEKTEQVAGQPN